MASGEPPGIVIGQPDRPAVTVGATDIRLYVWSVNFICGQQDDNCCGCAPMAPGRYATEINLHNPTERPAPVLKRVLPLVLAGAVVGREPRFAKVTAMDVITLPPHTATMDDCCRLQQQMLGAPSEGNLPLSTGILEIISTVELAVTAVYTTGSGAIKVAAVAARRLL